MPAVVLVTGGCGFIGTWVLREILSRGDRAVVVDAQPEPARWRRVIGPRAGEIVRAGTSVIDRDALRSAIDDHGVTHVIHLAALLTPACQHDPWLGCRVNVLGTTAVLDAVRLSGRVRAVAAASSYAVYGADAQLDSNGEVSDSAPTFYGAFKQAADRISEQYWRHFGIASLAIRPHVVYGPERDVGLTAGPSLAARAAARGEPYTIGYTGRAGYDYVEDVARAFVRAAVECPPGATVADLTGESATPEDFVRAIEAVAPESAGRIHVDGPPIPANVAPRPRPITNVFPEWRATPLVEGVRRIVEFYRNAEAPA